MDWLRRAAKLSTDASRGEQLRAEAAFVAAQASRFDDVQQSADDPVAAAYLALYRDGEVVASHHRIVSLLHDADGIDDAPLLRLVKLLLAITMYCGEQRLWQQTDDVVDRLAGRLDADTFLFRDAWGDVVRRGHGVRERLAQRIDRIPDLEPWDVMRLGVAAYYVDGLPDLRATLTRLYRQESDRGAVTNAMTMLHLLLLDQIGSGAWDEAQASVRAGVALAETHRNELFRRQFLAYDGLRAACVGDGDLAARRIAEVAAWAGPRRLGHLLAITSRAAILSALAEGDYPTAYAAAIRAARPGEFPPYSHHCTEGLLDFVEAAVHSGHLRRSPGTCRTGDGTEAAPDLSAVGCRGRGYPGHDRRRHRRCRAVRDGAGPPGLPGSPVRTPQDPLVLRHVVTAHGAAPSNRARL